MNCSPRPTAILDQVSAPSPHQAQDSLTSSSTVREDTKGTTTPAAVLGSRHQVLPLNAQQLSRRALHKAQLTREGITQQGRERSVPVAATTQPS